MSMSELEEKPAHVRLRGGDLNSTDFRTPGHRAAAEAILEYWDETHNFSAIAAKSDWSQSHIRNVFYEYFEAADAPDGDGLTSPSEIPDELYKQIYREAYRDGHDDGFEDGYEAGYKVGKGELDD